MVFGSKRKIFYLWGMNFLIGRYSETLALNAFFVGIIVGIIDKDRLAVMSTG